MTRIALLALINGDKSGYKRKSCPTYRFSHDHVPGITLNGNNPDKVRIGSS